MSQSVEADDVGSLFFGLGFDVTKQVTTIFTVGFNRDEVERDSKSMLGDLDFLYILEIGDREKTGEPGKMNAWMRSMKVAEDDIRDFWNNFQKHLEESRLSDDEEEGEGETSNTTAAPVDATGDCRADGQVHQPGDRTTNPNERSRDQEGIVL